MKKVLLSHISRVSNDRGQPHSQSQQQQQQPHQQSVQFQTSQRQQSDTRKSPQRPHSSFQERSNFNGSNASGLPERSPLNFSYNNGNKGKFNNSKETQLAQQQNQIQHSRQNSNSSNKSNKSSHRIQNDPERANAAISAKQAQGKLKTDFQEKMSKYIKFTDAKKNLTDRAFQSPEKPRTQGQSNTNAQNNSSRNQKNSEDKGKSKKDGSNSSFSQSPYKPNQSTNKKRPQSCDLKNYFQLLKETKLKEEQLEQT